MSHIFLSHSTQDKQSADRICSFLESQGISLWIAPKDIPPGADWAESILDGIDTASGMILIVSSATNDSPHIRREVERAVSRKIPIYPFIIEKAPQAKWMQYYISAHQWIDATGNNFESKLHDLSMALKPHINKDTKNTKGISEVEEQTSGDSAQKIMRGKFQPTNTIDSLKAGIARIWRKGSASILSSATIEHSSKFRRRRRLIIGTLMGFIIGSLLILIFFLYNSLLDHSIESWEMFSKALFGYASVCAVIGAIIGIIWHVNITFRKAFLVSAVLSGILSWLIIFGRDKSLESIKIISFVLLGLPTFFIVGLVVGGIVIAVRKWIGN